MLSLRQCGFLEGFLNLLNRDRLSFHRAAARERFEKALAISVRMFEYNRSSQLRAPELLLYILKTYCSEPVANGDIRGR
jgi:hypothetical protein